MSKGEVSVQQCRIQFREVTPFPVQLVLIVLNVPTLKHTPCCSVWVAVDDLHLTEVYAMACHKSMFCQCKSGYITITQCTLMLLQPVFQRSTRLPNVHLRAFCAGNRVDYSLMLYKVCVYKASVAVYNNYYVCADGQCRPRVTCDIQGVGVVYSLCVWIRGGILRSVIRFFVFDNNTKRLVIKNKEPCTKWIMLKIPSLVHFQTWQ